MGKYGQLGRIDLAIELANEGQVDTGNELDSRGLLRVVIATGDLEAIDAVLVHGLAIVSAGCPPAMHPSTGSK